MSFINKFKDNNKPAYWVGHSELRSLNIDEFFKRTPKFDEKVSSVTGKTEEEENTAKNTTYDADKNVEESERINKYKEKVVTIEEERKTLEYQETVNLDIENITSTSQQIWRSIYEVICDDYFNAVKLLRT